MIWKALQAVHHGLDNVMQTIPIPGTEATHKAIEQCALYMLWTSVIVMMASLVADWVMSTRLNRASEGVQ